MPNNARPITYELTKKMYNDILKLRGEDTSENPREYVMRYINEGFRLRGTVKNLHILGEGY